MNISLLSKLTLFVALALCTVHTAVSQLHKGTQCISSPTGELEFTALVRGVPGQEGPKGDKGEKGSIGPKGEEGDRGRNGRRGLKGDTGFPGMKGEGGDTGPRGPKGDTGLQGKSGNRGDSGLTGPQGKQGEKGKKGSKGQKGSTGPQGLHGSTGGPGLPGSAGQKGAHGPEGPEGKRGPQGDPGPAGPPGLQGPHGDTVLSQEEFDKVLQALQQNISAELSRIGASVMDIQSAFTKCGIFSTSWRRVALIDMTNPTTRCPRGLVEVSNTTTNQRACGRSVDDSCSSVTFPIGEKYSHVCGRVRGYQLAYPDAFYASTWKTINDAYIDGISITHGSPRRHLWSYAANHHERYRGSQNYICPCARPDPGNSRWYVPAFVGADYYCESGFVTTPQYRTAWEDPLWDGAGCVTPGNTCCQRHGWFHKQVNQTSDSIEVRWCADGRRSDDEDVYTDLVEIWILD